MKGWNIWAKCFRGPVLELSFLSQQNSLSPIPSGPWLLPPQPDTLMLTSEWLTINHSLFPKSVCVVQGFPGNNSVAYKNGVREKTFSHEQRHLRLEGKFLRSHLSVLRYARLLLLQVVLDCWESPTRDSRERQLCGSKRN